MTVESNEPSASLAEKSEFLCILWLLILKISMFLESSGRSYPLPNLHILESASRLFFIFGQASRERFFKEGSFRIVTSFPLTFNGYISLISGQSWMSSVIIWLMICSALSSGISGSFYILVFENLMIEFFAQGYQKTEGISFKLSHPSKFNYDSLLGNYWIFINCVQSVTRRVYKFYKFWSPLISWIFGLWLRFNLFRFGRCDIEISVRLFQDKLRSFNFGKYGKLYPYNTIWLFDSFKTSKDSKDFRV